MAVSLGEPLAQTLPQNADENLEFLAAASHFYGLAKLLAGLQFVITVPFAVASYVAVMIAPPLKLWATFAALTIGLLDALVLEKLQARLRLQGAIAQEQFDSAVLTIPWNEFVSARLEAAETSKAAAAYRARYSMAGLRDWYPTIASEVEWPHATLICQRSAVRWDGAQRRRYATILTAGSAAALFLLVLISLAKGYSVADFILGLYAPLSPAMLWTWREVSRQREAAEKLDRLKAKIDNIWERVLTGSTEPIPTRRIQNALFGARSQNALIFDWIYRLQRHEQEAAMVANAKNMVAALRALPADLSRGKSEEQA